MANTQRAALLTKAHKVLKSHFKVTPPPHDRSLLEHLLYAACLENNTEAKANVIFNRLKDRQRFFDWNEIRVSTMTELAESMGEMAQPGATASQVKGILQGVFENTYSFDLEPLKKQNLGAAIKELEKMTGPNWFVIHYAIQHAPEGHAIPLDRSAWEILVILGIANLADHKTGSLTGLERTIPKNKGIEFGMLLHHCAVEYAASPSNAQIRKVLTTINPQAVFPKKGESILTPPPPPPPVEKKTDKSKEKPGAVAAKPTGKSGAKSAEVKGKAAPAKSGKEDSAKHKSAAHNAKSNVPAKPVKLHKPEQHKSASHKSDHKKPVQKSKTAPVAKKGSSKQLAKRKPR
jgi:hypothetical protein